MTIKFKNKIHSNRQIRKNIANLKSSLRKKVLRKAQTEVGKFLVKKTRAAAPVQTKTLRRSINRKVKTYKTGVVVAIVGVRSKPTTAREVRVKTNIKRMEGRN